jgi:HlyD family secretion protein
MIQKIDITTVFFIAILCLSGCNRNSGYQSNKVKEGEFKESVTESGDLQAINSKVITMPFLGWKYGWRWQIINLENHGAMIHKGDIVVKIDASPVLKILEQETNKLELEQANLEKLYVTQKSQMTQIKSEYESEKSNYELITLQVDKFKFEPENKQVIKKKELEIAAVKLEQIENKLKLKDEVFQNEIKIQKIKLKQIKKSISEAHAAMDMLELTSPIDGVFQVDKNRRTRKMMQVGDEVHQGAIIARIPDMRKMKIISTINETDISKIKMGQEVIIRLDAYPEKPFLGKISYIGKLSRKKDKNNPIKVFDLEILVSDSDPALKPGMTVSCEIITNKLDKALFVENECIFQDSSTYFVYEKTGGAMNKITVQLIARNNLYTAIQGNVQKGQRLVSRNELENY